MMLELELQVLAMTIPSYERLPLCLCLALITLEGTITIRLFPIHALHLGADPFTTGLLVGAAFLTTTLGTMLGGWLSDRFGRHRCLLLISLAIWIPLTLLMIPAADLRWFMLATTLAWFPGGVALAMVNIVVAISTAEHERGKVFGWMALAAGLGTLAAGVLAGPIAERWGFSMLFLGMATIIGVMVLITAPIREQQALRQSIVPLSQSSTTVGVGGLLAIFLAAHLFVRLGQLIGGLAGTLEMI
jgi:MFS family permease